MSIHRIFLVAATSALLGACATNYEKQAKEFHGEATKGLDLSLIHI